MLKDRIRDLRLARGWNQTELAARAGLRQGTIANLETGKRDNPTQDTLQKLADAFQMTVTDLIEDDTLAGPWPAATVQALGLSEEFIGKYRRLWPHLSRKDRAWTLGWLQLAADAERRIQALEAAAAEEEPDRAVPADAKPRPIRQSICT